MTSNNDTWQFGPDAFEVVRHVTLPMFRIPENGEPVFFRIESAIEQSKDMIAEVRATRRKKGSTAGEDDAPQPAAPMAPPEICEVTDMKTGEMGQIIVNEQLATNLFAKYENDSYVGKVFQIRFLGLKKSRRGYNFKQFEITELRLKKQQTNGADQTVKTSTPAVPAKAPVKK